MRILFPHEMHNVVHLIGGYHGVKQIHLLMTVTAHRVHTGYAVSVLFYILVYDVLCLSGGNLQRNPFISVMKGRDGFGGYELEQDGISRIQPSEHVSEDAENHAVACKHIFPYGPSQLMEIIVKRVRIHAEEPCLWKREGRYVLPT